MDHTSRSLRRDLLFATPALPGGPGPGEPFPHFDLPTSDGERVSLANPGARPRLIALVSFTCPAAAAGAEGLKRLHEEFGERVAFVSVYVREARPTFRYAQPTTFDQKLAFAADYQRRDGIPWPVAVDALDEALHRQLDRRAGSVYLVDAQGRVARHLARVDDLDSLREALEALVSEPAREPLPPAAPPVPVPSVEASAASQPPEAPAAHAQAGGSAARRSVATSALAWLGVAVALLLLARRLARDP